MKKIYFVLVILILSQAIAVNAQLKEEIESIKEKKIDFGADIFISPGKGTYFVNDQVLFEVAVYNYPTQQNVCVSEIKAELYEMPDYKFLKDITLEEKEGCTYSNKITFDKTGDFYFNVIAEGPELLGILPAGEQKITKQENIKILQPGAPQPPVALFVKPESSRILTSKPLILEALIETDQPQIDLRGLQVIGNVKKDGTFFNNIQLIVDSAQCEGQNRPWKCEYFNQLYLNQEGVYTIDWTLMYQGQNIQILQGTTKTSEYTVNKGEEPTPEEISE